VNPYSLVGVASVAGLHLAVGMIPSRYANARIAWMRSAAFGVSLVSLLLSLIAAGLLAVSITTGGTTLFYISSPSPSFGIYFDSLSAVMLVLIQFIGTVIVGYSLRYLDGDASQGRFLRWICFTLGSVSMLVIAQNLLMFIAAWMMASFGLHQLLTHYSNRPAAILAARKKFLISRLGDLFLVGAVAITYQVFGTLDFHELFAAIDNISGESGDSAFVHLIGPLFVLGAMTKSAQFPFHSWLPDTMETPTPVSALMHAGVINAGGFLVIRLSPLISQSPLSLDFLAMVGAFTAIFGALVMLTQTSVKRFLAYSTIAQMGFMMLQCGLGAYSAALLHLVAHSLYKAHAFLSTGSVVEAAAARNISTLSAKSVSSGALRRTSLWAVSAGVAFTGWSIAAAIIGISWGEKPGGLLLGLVMLLAVTSGFSRALQIGQLRVVIAAAVMALAIPLAYSLGYAAVDLALASTASRPPMQGSVFQTGLVALMAILFVTLFVLQANLGRWNRSPWFGTFYVYVSNAFYFDITAQKITQRLWPSRST